MRGFLVYAAAGFLSGGVMFSYLIPKLFWHVDVIKESGDHNPGTANVVKLLGFPVGMLCLAFDLGKGFLPVFLASRALNADDPLFSLVLAAPVFGHAFSPMLKGRGGKAIAVTFGSLLGAAWFTPLVWCLAALFIFFSVVVVVSPIPLRVVVTFLLLAAYCLMFVPQLSFTLGGLMICAAVLFKHLYHNPMEKEKIRVSLLYRKDIS